jgi:hypothetical protein
MQTDDQAATFVLSRKRGGWRDRGRSYVVMVDGEPVAKIKHGQRLELPVRRGHHELLLKVDWCQSQPLAFDAEPGQPAEFFCEPGGSAARALPDTLMGSHDYISLTRVATGR